MPLCLYPSDAIVSPETDTMVPDLSSEGLRHVVALVLEALGSPHHQCPGCKNAFAVTCRRAHTWFYTTFDEPIGLVSGAVLLSVTGTGPSTASTWTGMATTPSCSSSSRGHGTEPGDRAG